MNPGTRLVAGRYRLENLPPGHYTLKAWVGGTKTLSRPVDLQAGSTVTVDFSG